MIIADGDGRRNGDSRDGRLIRGDRMLLCSDCGYGSRLLLAEGVGDEGLAMQVVGGVEGVVAGFFLGGEGGIQLASCDLFGGGVDEAELAGGEVVLGGARGWDEGAAEGGAVLVGVA